MKHFLEFLIVDVMNMQPLMDKLNKVPTSSRDNRFLLL